MKEMISLWWPEEFLQVLSNVAGIIWINEEGHGYDNVTVQ